MDDLGPRTYSLRPSKGHAQKKQMNRQLSLEIVPDVQDETEATMNREASMISKKLAVRRRSRVQQSVQGIGGVTIDIGDPVWVHEKGPIAFARATLSTVAGLSCRVTLENGKMVEKSCEELYAANRAQDFPDDHSTLMHLNEPCILHSTAQRFMADNIYTYTGRILIAVNPFRPLDIYGPQVAAMQQAVDDTTSLPPHVYSIAERAYSRLRSVSVSQAIVMSGESGAGKTETARHVVNYMIMRGGDSTSGPGKGITDAIVTSSDLTEAFGNSKTRRNNNSSRFGKYMILSFNDAGCVSAAAIQTYLLERSRVTQLITGERSYHVFYQLMATQDEGLRSVEWITSLSVSRCRVLATSECPTIEGVSDADKFELVDAALRKMGFGQERRYALYAMIAAVLHLMNVRFEATDADEGEKDAASKVTSQSGDALEFAGELLGCGSQLEALVTTRHLTSGRKGDVIIKALTVVEAERTRDAMARGIYSRMFHWIETQLNRSLVGDGSASLADMGEATFSSGTTISLLDIFGFESFKTNGFEQLCINYCNEKLQQFFLSSTFKQEQEVYIAEGVEYPSIDFMDNAGCVDAIDKVTKEGPGVLRLLESQCKAPEASDAKFFEDVNRFHKDNKFFKTVQRVKKKPSEAFIISHYAGDVCYGLERGSWLERESDKVRSEVEKALCESEVSLVRTVFKETSDDDSSDSSMKRHGADRSSVSRRFIKDLGCLMKELNAGEVHFVRCIKPNENSTPRRFNHKLVLEQMRASGIFDAVELMKRGYPTRMPYSAIHGKFASVMPPDLALLPPAEFSELCALACDVGPKDYALGRNQLFLRAGQGGLLEAAISLSVSTGGPVLEHHIRDYQVHKRAMHVVATVILAWRFRYRFMRTVRMVRKVQAWWRGNRARKIYGVINLTSLEALKKRDKSIVVSQNVAPKKRLKLKMPPITERQVGLGPLRGAVDSEEVARLAAELEIEKKENAALKEELSSIKSEMNMLREAQNSAAGVMVADFAQAAAERNEKIEELQGLLKAEEQRACDLEEELLRVRGELEAANAGASPKHDTEADDVVLAHAFDDGFGHTEPFVRDDYEEEDFKPMEERISLTITRDELSGTLGVDIDLWQGCVTVAIIAPGVPAEGKLVVGDEIEGVGGVPTPDMESVIKALMEAPQMVNLQIRRRPPAAVLRNEMQVRTTTGKWQYVMVTLLSTRMLFYELPEQAIQSGVELEQGSGGQGEINLLSLMSMDVDESALPLPTLTLTLQSGALVVLRYEPSREEGTASAAEKLKSWHTQMARMKSGDSKGQNLIKRGVVWQQGYMELAVGLDEWETCWFVLDEDFGLRVFANQNSYRSGSDPTLFVQTAAIGKVLRATGQSWYEFGLQIYVFPTAVMLAAGIEDTMIEVRAPSHAEMLRWLATINMKGSDFEGRGSKVRPSSVDRSSVRPSGVERSSVKPSGARPSSVRPSGISERDSGSSGASPGYGAKQLSRRARPHLEQISDKVTTKDGRRYSSVFKVCAMPTQLQTAEILPACWFAVRKEHDLLHGTKHRYCKLLGTNGSDAGPSAYAKVTLVMLHKEAEPIESGSALDVRDVVDVKLDQKGHKGRLTIVTHKRQIRMTAEPPAAAASWAEALLAQSAQLRKVDGSHGGRTQAQHLKARDH